MRQEEVQELSLPPRFSAKIESDLKYLYAYDGLKIEKIILFGSCARGNCKVTSDVDLLVVTENSVSRYIRGDISSELDEALDGVRTDVIFYARDVFESADSLLMREIRREGVVLYDAVQ